MFIVYCVWTAHRGHRETEMRTARVLPLAISSRDGPVAGLEPGRWSRIITCFCNTLKGKDDILVSPYNWLYAILYRQWLDERPHTRMRAVCHVPASESGSVQARGRARGASDSSKLPWKSWRSRRAVARRGAARHTGARRLEAGGSESRVVWGLASRIDSERSLPASNVHMPEHA